jgi:hypothetical protein
MFCKKVFLRRIHMQGGNSGTRIPARVSTRPAVFGRFGHSAVSAGGRRNEPPLPTTVDPLVTGQTNVPSPVVCIALSTLSHGNRTRLFVYLREFYVGSRCIIGCAELRSVVTSADPLQIPQPRGSLRVCAGPCQWSCRALRGVYSGCTLCASSTCTGSRWRERVSTYCAGLPCWL